MNPLNKIGSFPTQATSYVKTTSQNSQWKKVSGVVLALMSVANAESFSKKIERWVSSDLVFAVAVGVVGVLAIRRFTSRSNERDYGLHSPPLRDIAAEVRQANLHCYAQKI